MEFQDYEDNGDKLTIGKILSGIFRVSALSINDLELSVEKILKLIIKQYHIRLRHDNILHLDLNFCHGLDKLKFAGIINNVPVDRASNVINQECETTLKSLIARGGSSSSVIEDRGYALQFMDHFAEIGSLPSPKCSKCGVDCYTNVILCIHSIVALEENRSVSLVCPFCRGLYLCDSGRHDDSVAQSAPESRNEEEESTNEENDDLVSDEKMASMECNQLVLLSRFSLDQLCLLLSVFVDHLLVRAQRLRISCLSPKLARMILRYPQISELQDFIRRTYHNKRLWLEHCGKSLVLDANNRISEDPLFGGYPMMSESARLLTSQLSWMYILGAAANTHQFSSV